MKMLGVVPVYLVMAVAMPAVAGQDAAVEVQEGNVKQWMEYYKRERSQSNEPVTDKSALPESSQSGAGKTESGDSTPSQAPIQQPTD